VRIRIGVPTGRALPTGAYVTKGLAERQPGHVFGPRGSGGVALPSALPHPNVLGGQPQYVREPRPRIRSVPHQDLTRP
jgi:hypothetical protein